MIGGEGLGRSEFLWTSGLGIHTVVDNTAQHVTQSGETGDLSSGAARGREERTEEMAKRRERGERAGKEWDGGVRVELAGSSAVSRKRRREMRSVPALEAGCVEQVRYA